MEEDFWDTSEGKLIRGVQDEAKFWDASVRSSAIDAVRHCNSDDAKECMRNAELLLARSDACDQMKDRVIKLIQMYWPREKEEE